MKKTFLTLFVALIGAAAVHAQEIPERTTDSVGHHQHHRNNDKKQMAALNLTDAQKTQFRAINKDYQQKIAGLHKDSTSGKNSGEKLKALRAEHHDKMKAMLTPEQNAQMEKLRHRDHNKDKDFGEKRNARMKEELNLTDDQSAKLAENRKVMAEQMKSIRADNTLNDEQKKEKSKELMKTQRTNMRSILTDEQRQKMKEGRKHDKHHADATQ